MVDELDRPRRDRLTTGEALFKCKSCPSLEDVINWWEQAEKEEKIEFLNNIDHQEYIELTCGT